MVYLKPNGERVYGLLSVTPVVDETGAPIESLSIVLDITNMKLAEHALSEAKENTIRNERLAALGKLTGIVAHELRNPLGAVSAAVHVLRKILPTTDSQTSRALATTSRGVQRCESIITELLDFARAQGLQTEPIDIDKWLSGILDDPDLTSGVLLEKDLNCDIKPVSFDPEAIRRVIINVIDNARQAMTAEGGDVLPDVNPRLLVSSREQAGRVEIEFLDSGPGIPENLLAKVLEPLFSTKSFGTGLGLSIVQRIMQEHGGGVNIANQNPHGARVTLWLTRHSEFENVVES